MKQEAESLEVETNYIRASELKVHPCIGCMKCRETLKCCLPEDDEICPVR